MKRDDRYIIMVVKRYIVHDIDEIIGTVSKVDVIWQKLGFRKRSQVGSFQGEGVEGAKSDGRRMELIRNVGSSRYRKIFGLMRNIAGKGS